MSWTQASEPLCTSCAAIPAIETIIEARTRDLGGFSVERVSACVSPFRHEQECYPLITRTAPPCHCEERRDEAIPWHTQRP